MASTFTRSFMDNPVAWQRMPAISSAIVRDPNTLISANGGDVGGYWDVTINGGVTQNPIKAGACLVWPLVGPEGAPRIWGLPWGVAGVRVIVDQTLAPGLSSGVWVGAAIADSTTLTSANYIGWGMHWAAATIQARSMNQTTVTEQGTSTLATGVIGGLATWLDPVNGNARTIAQCPGVTLYNSGGPLGGVGTSSLLTEPLLAAPAYLVLGCGTFDTTAGAKHLRFKVETLLSPQLASWWL